GARVVRCRRQHRGQPGSQRRSVPAERLAGDDSSARGRTHRALRRPVELVIEIGAVMTRYLLISALLLASAIGSAQPTRRSGVLLLAHGGAKEWNERVTALATTIGSDQPVEVAFGMAAKATIQTGIDKLVARGVTSIVAVPLFVSSHSSVITSTQ